mmetsp:Transcript_12180/g.35659  ORF Transcript_12180/g.35659 Transcript_12180/m.35659 type:complete len:768 (-) Transcript_12180:84-2387(-)
MTGDSADVRAETLGAADTSSGDPPVEVGGSDYDIDSSVSFEPSHPAKVDDAVAKADIAPVSALSSLELESVTDGIDTAVMENGAREDNIQNRGEAGGKGAEKPAVVADARPAGADSPKGLASKGGQDSLIAEGGIGANTATVQNNAGADETKDTSVASDASEGTGTSVDDRMLGGEAARAPSTRDPAEDGSGGGVRKDDEGNAHDNGIEAQRARDKKTAALNVACEALVAARTLNLELEFAHVQTKKGVDLKRCTKCLRRAYLEDDGGVGGSVSSEFGNAGTSVVSPGKRARSAPRRMGSKLLPRNRASRCLICGSRACLRHSCKEFKKEGITICDGCSPFFSLEYLVEKCCPALCSKESGKNETGKTDDAETICSVGNTSSGAEVESVAETETVEHVAEEKTDENEGGDDENEGEHNELEEKATSEEETSSAKELDLEEVSAEKKLSPEEAEVLRQRHVHSVLDAYDHALLLLRYSCQFIPGIASSLRNNAKRNNRIGLGSSATSLVSGITGVAAGLTIFTPVGPPLLIASVLFGGGATAASAGSEAVNYKCEPTRLAKRIITLNAVVQSIGRLMDVMALKIEEEETTDVGDTEQIDDNDSEDSFSSSSGKVSCAGNGDNSDPKPETAAKGEGKAVTAIVSTTGGQVSKNASKHSSKMWSRATTNAMRAPHLTILIAGALSAFTVALEAREMAVTVKRINAGHPCDKADLLEEIRRELEGECGDSGRKEGDNKIAETSRELYETAELAEAFARYAAAFVAVPKGNS